MEINNIVELSHYMNEDSRPWITVLAGSRVKIKTLVTQCPVQDSYHCAGVPVLTWKLCYQVLTMLLFHFCDEVFRSQRLLMPVPFLLFLYSVGLQKSWVDF